MNDHTIDGWLQDDFALKFGKDSGTAWGRGTLTYRSRVKNRETDKWENGPSSWFQIVAFGRTAEILAVLPAGQLVRVSGETTIDYWTDDSDRRHNQTVLTVREVSLPILNPDFVDVSEEYISLRRPKSSGKRGPQPVPTGIEGYVDGEEPF